MSPELLAQLQDAAKREGRTQSWIIEKALQEYLGRQKGSGLPDELVKAVEQYLERHR
jgi:predicted transcriptional regulator